MVIYLIQYTEADLYKQLSYFCLVLDASRCLDKVSFSPSLNYHFSYYLSPLLSPFSVCLFLVLEMLYQPFFILTTRKIFDIIEQLDHKTRVPFERQLATIGQAVRLALEEIERMLDRCDYGWVRLSDIAVSIWLGMVVLHWDLSSFPGAVIIPCKQALSKMFIGILRQGVI